MLLIFMHSNKLAFQHATSETLERGNDIYTVLFAG